MQPNTNATSSSKTLIIAIILAVVVLIESIAIIILIANYTSLISQSTKENSADATIPESEFMEDTDAYDNEGNLKAIEISCSKDNFTYKLHNDNNYELTNASGIAVESGTYTITNLSLISLSKDKKVLYYDGYSLADGLTVYDCGSGTESK